MESCARSLTPLCLCPLESVTDQQHRLVGSGRCLCIATGGKADLSSLRAWIDQPLQILYFESRSAHEQDAEAQGTAGGLGVERVEKDVEPVGWLEKWDERIRDMGNKVSVLMSTWVAGRGHGDGWRIMCIARRRE